MAKSVKDIKLQQYDPNFKYEDFRKPKYDIYDEKIGLELLKEFVNAGNKDQKSKQEGTNARKK